MIVLADFLQAGPVGVICAALIALVALALRERRRRGRPPGRAGAPVWPTRRVLVVDDDPAATTAIERFLRGEAINVEVATAHSGEEGLALVRSIAFDLVLTDLRMPGMGGVLFVQGLRDASKRPLVPVVVMSGLEEHAVKALAQDAGATGWVCKPITAEALLEIVHSHLDPGLGLVRNPPPLVK